MAVERTGRAMGSDVHVIVVGPARLADTAFDRILDLESRWSRFVRTSEIGHLNAAGGDPIEVSPDTIGLVQRAVDAWRISGAFVDCTELDAVVAAGYDRSFDELPTERVQREAPRRGPSLLGPGDIVIDGRTVSLPRGVRFDPGGIGKGLAADIVTAELMAGGADGVCIGIGGDLCVDGIGPTGRGWTAAIAHPRTDTPLCLVGLTAGAVASSTTLKRRWVLNGTVRHHLIDPRTGRPSTSDIAFAAAIAAHGWQAEALAKAVLLRGGPHPFDVIEGTGVEALVVGYDGRIRHSSGFPRFTGGEAIPPLTIGASQVPA